jgi:hypothetical protein
MLSIYDIQFSNETYGYAEYCALLLFELRRICAVIELPNAHRITFIQVFRQTTLCQNYINTNFHRNVTLFAYDQNMQRWLADNTDIPHNVKEMKIFCHSDDQFYVREWSSFHGHRLTNLTINICTFEELNHELLVFGCKFIRKLRKQFQNNIAILNQLDDDYQVICNTLEDNAVMKAIGEKKVN